MLNWLRGKFGKRNKITKNTNLTISDDDSNDSVTLVNNREDLDDAISAISTWEDTAFPTSEAPISIATLESDNSSQSTSELSGSLKANRTEAARATSGEKSLSLQALSLKNENPTLSFPQCKAAVEAQAFYKKLLAEGKNLVSMDEISGELSQSKIAIPENIQTLFSNGKLPLLESDFMDVFMGNMDKLSTDERSIMMTIKNSYGDGFNSGSEFNN
jgi:hypothetical protein